MKKIFNWFSREDLDLKNKWWHRLFFVIFICSFLIFVGFQIASVDNLLFSIPQWKQVNLLNDRIDAKLNSVTKLLKIDEIIENININSNDLNIMQIGNYGKSTIDGISTDDIYCSSQIENYIEKIMKDRNIENLYMSSSNSFVSIDEFLKSIKENNIKCLTTDANTAYDTKGNTTGRITFLRTDKDLFFETLQNNRAFYQVSILKSILGYLGNFIGILLYSFILYYFIIIFYYKIILFIIFGNKKH